MVDQLIAGIASSQDTNSPGKENYGANPVLEMMKDLLENLAYYEQDWIKELSSGFKTWKEEPSMDSCVHLDPLFAVSSLEGLGIKDPEFASLIREFEYSLRSA